MTYRVVYVFRSFSDFNRSEVTSLKHEHETNKLIVRITVNMEDEVIREIQQKAIAEIYDVIESKTGFSKRRLIADYSTLYNNVLDQTALETRLDVDEIDNANHTQL